MSEFKDKLKECNEAYSYRAADTRDYSRDLSMTSWQTRDHNQTCATGNKHEFCYNSASDLDGYPYVGQRQLYAGGGYVLQLRGGGSSRFPFLFELVTYEVVYYATL